MSSLYGWLDLPTTTCPNWALVCRQATSKEEWTIVKWKGVYMAVENAKAFDFLDKKHKKIFKLMALPYELRHEILWLTSINLSVSGDTSLNSGFDAVHSLSFPYFSRYPHRSLPANSPNNDLRLMKKCHYLRKVELTFVWGELESLPYPFNTPKPLCQLRGEYRLDSMVDMFRLGELQLVVLRGPYNHGAVHPALQELAAWLRGEYALRANLHASLLNLEKKSAKALSVSII